MRRTIIFLLFLIFSTFSSQAQENQFAQFDFLFGSWSGEGKGFGNSTSAITASYNLAMNDTYIEVVHDSQFVPSADKPEGEHHVDKGFISFDKIRNTFVFRQFNNEGYVNQYLLVDSLSAENKLVFETEIIENFMPGGKARWTVVKISDAEIETIFDVSFPGKDYSCFGTNRMRKWSKSIRSFVRKIHLFYQFLKPWIIPHKVKNRIYSNRGHIK